MLIKAEGGGADRSHLISLNLSKISQPLRVFRSAQDVQVLTPKLKFNIHRLTKAMLKAITVLSINPFGLHRVPSRKFEQEKVTEVFAFRDGPRFWHKPHHVVKSFKTLKRTWYCFLMYTLNNQTNRFTKGRNTSTWMENPPPNPESNSQIIRSKSIEKQLRKQTSRCA